MNEELKNLIKVWIFALISISYCYYVSTRIKAGVFRLLSVLPVCALFLLLPIFLSSVHWSASTAFFLSWLANFRLILFSFNLGLLSPLPSNLFQFICFTCFPINPDLNPNRNPKPKFSQWNVAIKVIFSKKIAIKVAMLGLVLHMYDHKQHLSPIVLLCLYPLHLYLVLEILLKLFNVSLFMVVGFDLEPQLNEPYLATSLEEFWDSWRNLMRSESQVLLWGLMSLIPGMNFDLFMEMFFILPFLVSGALHELLFFYITREPPTGEVTLFFVLHGHCYAAEEILNMMNRRFDKKMKKKTWVSQMIVVGFMGVTADWLFFPPLVRSGKIQKLANESQIFYFWVIKLLKS